MPAYDPYLTQSIEMMGRTATIIALQNYGALHSARARRLRDNPINILIALNCENTASWAYREARCLMGINFDDA